MEIWIPFFLHKSFNIYTIVYIYGDYNNARLFFLQMLLDRFWKCMLLINYYLSWYNINISVPKCGNDIQKCLSYINIRWQIYVCLILSCIIIWINRSLYITTLSCIYFMWSHIFLTKMIQYHSNKFLPVERFSPCLLL